MDPPVLVTGATGYLASHLIQQLIQQGKTVRGTVRDLENKKEIAPLRNLWPEAEGQLELVEADILKPDTWQAALGGGVREVYHLATLFGLDPSLPDEEIIRPALEGTKNVLEACRLCGTVRRVVMTSGIITIINKTPTEVFDENDWAESTDDVNAFQRSKILSERAALKFVNALPEEQRFELAVINSGYMMGPLLYHSEPFSASLPKQIMERLMVAVPKLQMHIVDVRDVATAHIRAMTLPEAAGHRHIVIGDSIWYKQISEIAKAEFKTMGYQPPTGEFPNGLLKFVSWFDKSLQAITPHLGRQVALDNTRMRKVLDVQPRPVRETILDMCYNLIELNIIYRTKGYIPRTGREEKI